MSTDTIHSLAVNGVNLHWLDKGHGHTLIFIPGSNGDYRTWANQLDFFSSKFRVIALSRRYQFPGRFETGGSSTVEENCNDILQLLLHLHINKVTIVGHSFGGYVAIAFAQKYPDFVDRLVLEEPTVFPFIMRRSFNPLQLIPLFLKDFNAARSFLRSGLKGIKPTRKYLAKNEYNKAKLSFVNGIVGHPLQLHELNPVMRQGLDDNIATFAAESETAFRYPLTIAQIRSMQVRTLLLKSDKSPRWFAYICKRLNQVLPNTELITLNASTHWLHLDEATLFNSTVGDFIEKK